MKLNNCFILKEEAKISEKQIHYGIEKKCINQSSRGKFLKLLDKIVSKVVYKKRLKKVVMESLFCSLCNQVVVIKLMSNQVLSENHFLEFLIRKR